MLRVIIMNKTEMKIKTNQNLKPIKVYLVAVLDSYRGRFEGPYRYSSANKVDEFYLNQLKLWGSGKLPTRIGQIKKIERHYLTFYVELISILK